MLCAPEYPRTRAEEIDGRWALVAAVHTVFSQKGGVGKTTIAVNLAAVVADTIGSPPDAPTVLVASIDPQASAVWWAERTDVAALPFDFRQMDDDIDAVSSLAELDYMHVFVDAPGSLARPRILAKTIEVTTDFLVPCELEPLAYLPTLRSVQDFIPPGKRYRVVRNKWERRDGHSDLEATTKFLDDNELVYARTVIRKYKLHATASSEGRVVTQYPNGRTATEAEKDFTKLALECGYGGTA